MFGQIYEILDLYGRLLKDLSMILTTCSREKNKMLQKTKKNSYKTFKPTFFSKKAATKKMAKNIGKKNMRNVLSILYNTPDSFLNLSNTC